MGNRKSISRPFNIKSNFKLKMGTKHFLWVILNQIMNISFEFTGITLVLISNIYYCVIAYYSVWPSVIVMGQKVT